MPPTWAADSTISADSALSDLSKINLPETKRPKIGLALSGGGARGAAHIGVLRALEEKNIPIDCIAGTSMGATVGGMYASGYTVDEIETQFREMDWSIGFKDRTPRENLTYRRKQDDASFLVDIDVGFQNNQLVLPRGVLFGQSLNLQLKLLTAKSRGIHNLDQLPIPFRAVAADLVTGDAVIIGQGDLADALHASAAIPGVYAPVQRNGKLLVDGGVAQNLPIETVRAMCADIVIAVDVSTPMRTENELGSLVDVIDQLSNLLTRRNRDASVSTLTSRDLLIMPELSAVSASDFLAVPTAIDRGYEAATGKAPEIERIVAITGEHERKLAVANNKPIRLTKIKLDNQSAISDYVILNRLSSQLGKPLDQQKLHTEISHLHGTGYFGFIDYNIVVNEQNQASANLKIENHPLAPNFLRFHVALEDSFKGKSSYSVGARHTYLPANELGGEWRNELVFGDESRLFTEWFQPWTYDGNWFTGLSAQWERRTVNVIENNTITSELRYTGTEAKLYGGYQYDSNMYVVSGLRSGTGNSQEIVGTSGENLEDLDVGEAYIEIGFDKLDHRYFPQHGRSGYLNIAQGSELMGAEEAYNKWTLNWLQATTRGKNTFGYQLQSGSFLSDSAPIQEQYQAGGFLRLSGFNRDELIGPHWRFFNVFYMHRLNNKVSAALDTPIYLGSSLEWGNVWQQEQDIRYQDAVLAGSVFLGIDTTFGPLYVAYGLNDEDRDALYLFLGSPF